ncbi:MAG: cell wall-binding repeat-containing protein [Oscillospiraceae bacterium]|nr:cell wall-binding repeat-containing protein [Oscillospiraceae bacterium]
MNMLKKTLAMFLVLCMMLGAVPVTVFAAESTGGFSSIDMSDFGLTGDTSEAADTGTTYATKPTKPADGTVTGEPFDTSVSKNYRIPGLVNFKGTLIATADARWDYEKDGGGMDLVVSRSADGNTWNYTFAGYLGDNGNVWNKDSSTLMDPVIVTDGTKLYLFADMYPAGYSISSSSTSNVFDDTGIGFDNNGNLLLSKDSRSTYGYYLKDGKIYNTAGAEQSGYTVKGWYDLYLNDEYVTNLFFSDSPFQVRATSYICMTTSTDGVTWSDPTLLNVKPEGTAWMVLGPGSGLVTQDKDIAFTAYDGSNIYLIWGNTTDGWNRVQTSAAGNESSIIELNDGTIRAFVKRTGNNTIAYVDFTKTDSGYTAGNLVDTGVANFSTCMVSSLHYSKLIDGKEAVLVCCPSYADGGTWGGRFNGKIYVFTLDDKNAMTLLKSYQVNNNFFAYSNMAELSDGSIGLLYEDDCISYSAGNHTGTASHITYTKLSMSTIAPDATISEAGKYTLTDTNTNVTITVSQPVLEGITVSKAENSTPAEGYTAAVTYSIMIDDVTSEENYAGAAEVKIPYDETVFNGCNKFVGHVDGTEFAVVLQDGYFVGTAPHFSDVTISGMAVDTTTVDVTLYVGQSKTVTIDGYDYSEGTGNNTGIATMAVVGNTTPVGKVLNAVTEIESGEQYLLYNNRAGKTLTNTPKSPGLLLDGTATVENTNLWTIVSTGTDKEYTVCYGTDGGYLNVGYETASLSNSAVTLQLDYGNYGGENSWLINDQQGWYGLNDYTGTATTAAGWSYASTDNGSWWTIYEIVSTEESSSTAVTFTGVAKGTTTATVGNVTYNITVLDAADATAGDIADFNNIVGVDTYSDDNDNATYRSDLNMAGKKITSLTISERATFHLGVDITGYDKVEWSVADSTIASVDANGNVTGVAAGTTTVTATVYKGNVKESITIPVEVKASLIGNNDTPVPLFYYIETVDNTKPYYTMFISSYSKAAPIYSMVPVTQGQVIYLERPQNSAFACIWTATPEDGYALIGMGSTGSISEYYPLKNGTDLGNETVGDVTYYVGSQAYNNIAGENNVAKDAEADWEASLNSVLENSISSTYNCDGAMSMTRWDHDGVPKMVSSMTFISEKLPEVEKTLNGVLPVTMKAAEFRYYAGKEMIATVDEYVYFTITVTQEAPTEWALDDNGKETRYSLLTYSASELIDNVLPGAYFYTKELDATDGDNNGDHNNDGSVYDGIIVDEAKQLTTQDITVQLNAAWTDAEIAAGERTAEFYVVYRIRNEDLPADRDEQTITNTVKMNFTYKSTYSNATASATTDAKADIHVIGAYPGIFVIDFGQPFSITDIKGKYGFANVDVTKTSSTYGTVTIDKDTSTLTYTPTSILQGEDAVILYNSNGDLVNGFRVYPATSVYYEEGFMFTQSTDDEGNTVNNYSGTWTSTGSKATETVTQTTENLGTHVHNYGFDPIYDGDTSNGEVTKSYAETSSLGATTTFTFTGTGFELYADCTEGTGYVSVRNKGTGVLETVSKLFMIDTVVGIGGTSATEGQTDNFDSLPIVSVKDLEWGTYEVTIVKTHDEKPIYLDGVRIINTIEDSTIFTSDLEDEPAFYQLRDITLLALNVNDVTSSKYGSDVTKIAQQVYNDAAARAAATGTDVFSLVVLYDPYGELESESTETADTGSTENEEGSETTETISIVEDLLDNGPKNELFLYANQSLTFKVTTNRAMQIGLKAPKKDAKYSLSYEYSYPQASGSVQIPIEIGASLSTTGMDSSIASAELNTEQTAITVTAASQGQTTFSVTDADQTIITYSVNVDANKNITVKVKQVKNGADISTSVDMYYELDNPIGTNYTYTVTISVSTGTLSVTDLKICDDPNATFEPLTVEDIEKILIDAGYGENETEPDPLPTEPEETVPEETTPEETTPSEPEDEENVGRLAGENRFDTALVIADQMKKNLGIEKFDAVVVASGANFADALAGSYLASVKNAPILLSYTTEEVNDTVKEYILNNLNAGGTVYILGGETAVPADFEEGLDAFTVKRLNGDDRFGTNLAILAEAGVEGKDILVCTGLEFADSLSASASGLPILLVWKNLTDEQKAFLDGLDGNKLYIIGGKTAVDSNLEMQLEKYGEVERIGGNNRFETSVLIAETFFENPESAVLAYAWNYPDGLCGGILASTSNAPLILTMTKYESAAADYINSHGIGMGTVLGGDSLISDDSVRTIFSKGN